VVIMGFRAGFALNMVQSCGRAAASFPVVIRDIALKLNGLLLKWLYHTGYRWVRLFIYFSSRRIWSRPDLWTVFLEAEAASANLAELRRSSPGGAGSNSKLQRMRRKR